MKLTTTLHLLKQHSAYSDSVERLLAAYPTLGEHDEIELIDMLNNGHNTVRDVIWSLRATKQDSRSVSVEFAKRCAARAADFSATARADASYDAARAAAYAAQAASEREKQKQDLIELTQHNSHGQKS